MTSARRVANDLAIYEDFASEWWNPRAPRFRSLQHMTPFRLTVLREWLGDLRGRNVLDLGCGGGLLAVPLSQAGAHVTGIDQSVRSLQEAQLRATPDTRFMAGDIRAVPLPDGTFDVVLLADVLDHLPDYSTALSEAARLLRPGGQLFVSTINRTFWSWLFAIVLGEGLRLIPPGTHDHSLFITPTELTCAAKKYGLIQERVAGEHVRIIPTVWRWAITMRRGRSLKVGYTALYRKG